jgi:ketosteroid isomerase-like protein
LEIWARSGNFLTVKLTRSKNDEIRISNDTENWRNESPDDSCSEHNCSCRAAQASQTDLSPKPQITVEREIESLEEARNQAVLHGDVAALDRMTSDDYTFITLRGELRTKSDILKGFASGSFHYESRQISDLKVRVYGDTAIVTGRSMQKGMENGKDYSGDYRFTRVYVKEKGHWVTVALQTTLIRE